MKINVTTPANATISDIDCEWSLTRPVILDRLDCREMDLTVDRRIPISQFSIITAEDDGMIKFRGYCESNTIDSGDSGKTTWAVKGMENLLNARFTNRWFWKKESSAISEILSDTLTAGSSPGLLAMANSAVPPGLNPWAESATYDELITLTGYGTDSHFGQKDVYMCAETGLIKLTEYSEEQLPFQTNGFFRDADDLQVKFTERCVSWQLHGGLFIENAYDTTIRLGNVYDSSQTLVGDLDTNTEEIGDLIADIINYMEWTLRIRDDENYTYLDLMLEDGVGSTGGLYTIVEGEPGFISLEKSTTSDPIVHAVIGQGIGEQRYSLSNSAWAGIRIHECYEVDSGFVDANTRLPNRVTDRYAKRQEDQQYDIEILKSYLLYPGDYIKFCPMYASPVVLRSYEIEEDSTGKTKLSLGGKNLTFTDVEDSRTSIPRGMSDEYIKTLQKSLAETETIHVSDYSHTYAPTGLTFAVPYGVTLDKYNPRVTLALTLALQDDTEKWASGHAYIAGEDVYHEKDSKTSLFRCKSDHTAGATTEPDIGVDWATRWDNVADAREIDLGRCSMEMTIDDTTVPDGDLVGISVGSSSTFEIDVTDFVTEEDDNVIKIWIRMADDYELTHTGSEDHPEIVINASMNFYKRLAK